MKILAFLDSAAGGDWPPLLGLMALLRHQRHEIDAVCDQALVTAVAGAGCLPVEVPADLGLGRCLGPLFSAMERGEMLPSGDGVQPLAIWGGKAAMAASELLGRWRPELVLSTLFCQEAAMATAQAWRIPWVVVNPSFFFGDRKRQPHSKDFSPGGLLLYRHWLLPPMLQADLVLHATDPLFDGAGSLPARHLYLGPLSWELPGELPRLIATPGPPWLLLSLSTSPQQDDQRILELAALALAGMECRVLVTLASSGRPIKATALPANFFVHGYVPHSLVLPHCRVAISHGGHGLVLKAMRHGVPQLLVPWGRDQPGVASRAAALRVARVLRPADIDGESLGEMVSNLLADSGWHDHACDHARRLASMRLLPVALQRLQQVAAAGRHRR
jgi:UDP:flavonoid glycosyltransferase YjiC (YdhE family)